MSGELNGKVILVTGGTHGIGKTTVTRCLEQGADVAFCARNREEVESEVAVHSAQAGNERVMGFTADVADEPMMEDGLVQVIERFGRVNGLIHSAGIYGPIGNTLDVPLDEWMNTIRINLGGSVVATRVIARYLKGNGGGRIVLFSGGGAASPFPNYSAYGCSKAAVVRLVETLSIELSPFGVEINCVAPGFVATRLHQETLSAGPETVGKEFFARTAEVIEKGGVSPDVGASCASYLVSDLAAGITGRFVAAPYDDYRAWPTHLDEIADSDFFTLRRIIPRDRGQDWQ
jgi:NAD(P)-dependent dehydrogenase (short-subunit alcohol dehydrogenase family)